MNTNSESPRINGPSVSGAQLMAIRSSGETQTLTEKLESAIACLHLQASGNHEVYPENADSINEVILALPNGIEGDESISRAATKLQKVYRSYRTRRRLADSAVIAEELWWQAIDFVRLSHSTISFFDYTRPETAISRWNRVSINASKVGQGLSRDKKALKLSFQHWIEAIDPRHRYGHNLHLYYEIWCNSNAGQPFFYWLDLGNGKNVDLKECPRSLLRQQCIKYMGPLERMHYEYVLTNGQILHKQTARPLNTTKEDEGEKWIFVMSTSKRLYAGVKKQGMLQHSSFLAGGSVVVAGRFIAEDGFLKAIWPYSGHYRPSDENLNRFLNYLKENDVDLTKIKIRSSSSKDMEESEKSENESAITFEDSNESFEVKNFRNLSGGIWSSELNVSETAIHERIKLKLGSSSCQLGNQITMKWSTGVGPRIGCVADYPMELRFQALEFMNLSPTHSQRFSCMSPFPPG